MSATRNSDPDLVQVARRLERLYETLDVVARGARRSARGASRRYIQSCLGLRASSVTRRLDRLVADGLAETARGRYWLSGRGYWTWQALLAEQGEGSAA